MRRYGVIFILFLLFFLPSVVFAGGQKEGDPILEVSSLIDQRKYNDAVLLLADIAKNSPERFDEVQAQLIRIRTARAGINEKYGELLDTFESDLEQAYVLIKELEELDPFPNERSLDSIVRARETAGFVYNRNRWEEIMNAAMAQIEQGYYWEAVEIYKSGFDLSRDIFDGAEYGEIVVDLVDTRTAELNQLVETFALLETPLGEHIAAETESFSSEPLYLDYLPPFETLLDDITKLNEVVRGVQNLAKFYLDFEESIRLSQEDEKEVHHLIYLALIISGRPDSPVEEGIVGVVETLWRDNLTALIDSLKEDLED